MTKKEIINRNIGLTFDFLRQAVRDPSLLDKIPDGSTLEFVEKDFSKIEKEGKPKSKVSRKYIRVKSELQVV
jgi:hypothetical protein